MSFERIPRFKYIIIGNSSVGKSAILERFIEKRFANTGTTIGVDYGSKLIHMNEFGDVKLQIWDTAGQEMYRSIVQTYFRNTGGIIMVYDVTDITSARDLEKWHIIVKERATPNIPIIVVGNKTDLYRDDTHNEVHEIADLFAMRNNYLHLKCSAKNNYDNGISDIFTTLTSEIFTYLNTHDYKDNPGLILNDYNPSDNKPVIGRNRSIKKKVCCN